jgi:pimeloyl-ACP methyl ester carboxylesterase
MQEKQVTVNRIALQIRDYEHEGEAIIFLHFSGANLMMWQRSIPFFQDRFRVILVDLRGHGKSDKPKTGYHIDQMASDVVGIMEQLELKRAHIVGSSLGAEVGLSLAATYPEKVISLVCEGAPISEFGPYSVWEGSEDDYKEHVAHEMENVRNAQETIFPSSDALVDARRKVFEKNIGWNETFEAMERYGAFEVGEGGFRKSFGKQALQNYMEQYFQCRFEEYYRKIKCPLLLLCGAETVENERERATLIELRELAAHGEIVEVNEWMHPYGWLLYPEKICKTILDFLREPSH